MISSPTRTVFSELLERKDYTGLYEYAKKHGVSHNSSDKTNRAYAFGTEHNRTHYVVQCESLVVEAIDDEWEYWLPWTKKRGATPSLAVTQGSTKLFSAKRTPRLISFGYGVFGDGELVWVDSKTGQLLGK